MFPFTSVNSPTPAAGGIDFSIFVMAIVVLIVIRRVYRGMNGRQFRASRIFTIPILYTLLLLASFFSLGADYVDEASLLLLILPGVIVGMRFGKSVKFFEKDSQIYYKRSQFILVFWLVSLLVRESLALFYPTVAVILLAVDALLSLTTGLIIGESVQLYYAHGEYVRDKANNADANK